MSRSIPPATPGPRGEPRTGRRRTRTFGPLPGQVRPPLQGVPQAGPQRRGDAPAQQAPDMELPNPKATCRKILLAVRRKSLSGRGIADALGLDYDYTRKLLRQTHLGRQRLTNQPLPPKSPR